MSESETFFGGGPTHIASCGHQVQICTLLQNLAPMWTYFRQTKYFSKITNSCKIKENNRQIMVLWDRKQF